MSSAETALFVLFWVMVVLGTGFGVAAAVRVSFWCLATCWTFFTIAALICLYLRDALNA